MSGMVTWEGVRQEQTKMARSFTHFLIHSLIHPTSMYQASIMHFTSPRVKASTPWLQPPICGRLSHQSFQLRRQDSFLRKAQFLSQTSHLNSQLPVGESSRMPHVSTCQNGTCHFSFISHLFCVFLNEWCQHLSCLLSIPHIQFFTKANWCSSETWAKLYLPRCLGLNLAHLESLPLGYSPESLTLLW